MIDFTNCKELPNNYGGSEQKKKAKAQACNGSGTRSRKDAYLGRPEHGAAED